MSAEASYHFSQGCLHRLGLMGDGHVVARPACRPAAVFALHFTKTPLFIFSIPTSFYSTLHVSYSFTISLQFHVPIKNSFTHHKNHAEKSEIK